MKDREDAQALGGIIAWFAITTAWWMLALWPVENGPEWLARTRYVCFGVNESGLPDTGGWIGLIGGPVGMLVILIAGWFRGIRSLLEHARRSRGVAFVMFTLALGVVALVTGAALRVQQARTTTAQVASPNLLAPEAHPRLDQPAPALSLVDQNGVERTLADFRGRPVLVTFAFAHCTTLCPLVVTHVLRAQEQLRGMYEPAVLIVTLDPWRDTPGRLAAIAASWRLPPNASLLSGSVSRVQTMLDAWQVPRTRDDRTGSIVHPSLVYVVDREGNLAFATTGESQALTALVRRL